MDEHFLSIKEATEEAAKTSGAKASALHCLSFVWCDLCIPLMARVSKLRFQIAQRHEMYLVPFDRLQPSLVAIAPCGIRITKPTEVIIEP